MKNSTKIKFTLTIAKVVVLFKDGSTKISNEEIVGKYTLNNARKKIKENYPSDFDEIKEVENVEVLSVEYKQRVFEVNTEHLYLHIISDNKFVEEVTNDLNTNQSV